MKAKFIGNNVIYINDIFIDFRKISAISELSNERGILNFHILVDG